MAEKPEIKVRAAGDADHTNVTQALNEHWGSTRIVTRGRIHATDKLPTLIAEANGEMVGVLTYDIYGQECELITMNAFQRGLGIGTAMLSRLREIAAENNCRGIWLITTNDNVDAMRFYQKKGFFFVAVHRDAVVAARRLKPEIPVIGNHGIPIRDEIELVMPL